MPSRIVVGMTQNNVVRFKEELTNVEKGFPKRLNIRNDPGLPKRVHWPEHKIYRKYPTLCKKDMTEEERKNYWCSKMDDKKVFMEAKNTVKMIMMGRPFDDVTNCARGLECKTRNESMRRVRVKKTVKTAMKTEQELQRLEGRRNPERLAQKISGLTKELTHLAAKQGFADERDVLEYMEDIRGCHEDYTKYIKSHSVPSSE